jgi:SAM-dependent methyltransferase
MQERYLVRRGERFAMIIRMIRATQGTPARVVDLGCGTGSLTEHILEAFPECAVVGLDVDPTMLLLARPRLAKFGDRVKLFECDLRDERWPECIEGPVDAVVSATSLHWVSPDALSEVYKQIAGILKPGGIFLNADHVASEDPNIQKSWEEYRQEMRGAESPQDSDTWDEFFEAYAAALNVSMDRMGEKSIGEWEGIEDGMPLAWHVARLRGCGFVSVDCFWRCNCDAIYGGICGVE